MKTYLFSITFEGNPKTTCFLIEAANTMGAYTLAGKKAHKAFGENWVEKSPTVSVG